MGKEEFREETGFPATTVPCFSTSSERVELKRPEIGSTASIGSMPSSAPSQLPSMSPEVFLGMVHRLMEEQQQRHAQQQSMLTQLYQDLCRSVGGLRDEVRHIGISLEKLQKSGVTPPVFPLQTSHTITSSKGREEADSQHHHSTDVPPTTLHTPRSLSPSSFSKTLAAGAVTPEGMHAACTRGAPGDHDIWVQPMKGEAEGEKGSDAKTTQRRGPGSGVEARKTEKAEEEEEEIQALPNVGPRTPQRCPHLPSVDGSRKSTMMSAHSSAPFDTPVGRRLPDGMRGGDHHEATASEEKDRLHTPLFSRLQEETEEGGKEVQMLLMQTPTAQVGTQEWVAVEEEDELGRSILEEMSRELERDASSRSSHYTTHPSHGPSHTSGLLSYTPNLWPHPSPPSHTTEDSSTHKAVRGSRRSSRSRSTSNVNRQGGGTAKPTVGTTPTAATPAEKGQGGMGNATAAPRAAAEGAAGDLPQTSPFSSDALSSLKQQIQEASAHYDDIFEKIASSPLPAGLVPLGGIGSGGVGSRASPLSSSASLHSAPGGAGGGVPSLWLEGASTSPSLSTAAAAGAAASRGGSGSGGGLSLMASGSHTSALQHTPIPTGRSAAAMTTPSQPLPSSPTRHTTSTSLHTGNPFGIPSSAALQQLHGSHGSNFIINSTTNSFISLDPGMGNAAGTEMSPAVLGTRPMMMRSMPGDGGTLSPSFHSGTGGSLIGGGTNTSTSSGSVTGAHQRKNSTSGIGMLSTEVSGITAEEINAMELLQNLSELPCTNGVTVTYQNGRPRVHAQPHHSSSAPRPLSSSQDSKPTDSSSTKHPSQSSSASTVSSVSHGKHASPTTTADTMHAGAGRLQNARRDSGGRMGATEEENAAGGPRGVSDSYASSAAPVTRAFEWDEASASTEQASAMDEPEHFGLQRHQPYHVLVEFKRHRTTQFESDTYVAPGKFVLVGADRGEDLGLVICTWCEDMTFPSSQPSPLPLSSSSHSPFSVGGGSSAVHPAFAHPSHPLTTIPFLDNDAASLPLAASMYAVGSGGNSGMNANTSHNMSNSSMNTSTSMIGAASFPLHALKGLRLHGAKLPASLRASHGTVLRLASNAEVSQLYMVQAELERRAMDVCQQRVLERKVPMVLVYAEYQYDLKKLTFFYEAQQRTDFRELVRDLYKSFRARIWMEPVVDSGSV